MSSTRSPGKVLHQINGKPLIEYLITRLKFNFHGKICCATSDQTSDDAIEKLCIINKIPCFRGSLEDVAKRMVNTVNFLNVDAFVRINGDSPLLDPKIVERAIKIYQNGQYDLVTNSFPRSFPIGQSVEVIKTSTFEKTYAKMSLPDEFEHVTHYYYNHPDEFRIKNFKNNRDLSKYSLVVDTPEDLNQMKKIIGSMTKPHIEYGLDELIELYSNA
tara:strand:- start:695 stop:1342 length:648 start_codon:yes stop_codon:yes gene_type:complete